ncbi:DUF1294 domain-containing protein [Chromobacterium haemolyticum]|uniref:DUF1294 domain-containing protein n=1 Tax=Chromobacterium haemolyticum TaxID=394935 RepID=UPI0009DB1FD9|nr:DUF1294 domain-containing protein [Chromobacterium haemolyticum]OQS34403.1 hypothetical protein B0T39_19675 [Chromobacterium haemolyticum]
MPLAVVFLAVLPALALLGRLEWAVTWLYLSLSLLCFVLYWRDKRAAERGGPRTPEARLLWLGVLCGWPGGLMARRLFRHKTVKQPFRLLFWCGAALNLAALSGWLYLRAN